MQAGRVESMRMGRAPHSPQAAAAAAAQASSRTWRRSAARWASTGSRAGACDRSRRPRQAAAGAVEQHGCVLSCCGGCCSCAHASIFVGLCGKFDAVWRPSGSGRRRRRPSCQRPQQSAPGRATAPTACPATPRAARSLNTLKESAARARRRRHPIAGDGGRSRRQPWRSGITIPMSATMASFQTSSSSLWSTCTGTSGAPAGGQMAPAGGAQEACGGAACSLRHYRHPCHRNAACQRPPGAAASPGPRVALLPIMLAGCVQQRRPGLPASAPSAHPPARPGPGSATSPRLRACTRSASPS